MRLPRLISLLGFAVLATASAQSRVEMKELKPSEVAHLLSLACGRGAIEATYAFAADRMPTDIEQAAARIAASTARRCVTSLLVDAYMTNKSQSPEDDRRSATSRAQAAYAVDVLGLLKIDQAARERQRR